jgi:hypothetical protein
MSSIINNTTDTVQMPTLGEDSSWKEEGGNHLADLMDFYIHTDRAVRFLNVPLSQAGVLLSLSRYYDCRNDIPYRSRLIDVLENFKSGEWDSKTTSHPSNQVFLPLFADIQSSKDEVLRNMGYLGSRFFMDGLSCRCFPQIVSGEASVELLYRIERLVHIFLTPLFIHTTSTRDALLGSLIVKEDIAGKVKNHLPKFDSAIFSLGYVYSCLVELAKDSIQSLLDKSLSYEVDFYTNLIASKSERELREFYILFVILGGCNSTITSTIGSLAHISKSIASVEEDHPSLPLYPWVKWFSLQEWAEPVETIRRIQVAHALQISGIGNIFNSTASFMDVLGVNHVSDTSMNAFSAVACRMAFTSVEKIDEHFAQLTSLREVANV